MASIVTAADVLSRTGATVTDAQIAQAQGIVELFTGYDLSTVDWSTVQVTFARDQRKLRLAVAYQAAFIAAHPDVFTSADVNTSTADGASQSGPQMWAQVAPLARVALRKLSKNRSRSVKVVPDELAVRFYNGVGPIPEWTDEYDQWVPLS
jgi:hypothetical protein